MCEDYQYRTVTDSNGELVTKAEWTTCKKCKIITALGIVVVVIIVVMNALVASATRSCSFSSAASQYSLIAVSTKGWATYTQNNVGNASQPNPSVKITLPQSQSNEVGHDSPTKVTWENGTSTSYAIFQGATPVTVTLTSATQQDIHVSLIVWCSNCSIYRYADYGLQQCNKQISNSWGVYSIAFQLAQSSDVGGTVKIQALWID